jgi:hypothetical protein
MDSTKAFLPDCRHRLLLHNAWGIFVVERVFGVVIKRASDDKEVPLRPIVEQHILEDFGGHIPTVEECLRDIAPEDWMCKGARPLSRYFLPENEELPDDATPTTE